MDEISNAAIMTYNAGLPENLWHPKQTENGHDSRLETQQENWLDLLKENGHLSTTKIGSPISPRDNRTQDALDENGKAKNTPSFKGTGSKA